MTKLTRREYKVMCEIFKAKENTLRKAMSSLVKQYYPEGQVISTKDYIYAWGDIPIGLVAHLDTVHKTPPFEIFHDERKGVIWSPEGIGADDRAGVYAIFSLLQEGYRPTIIFCTQEESGGIGAEKLVQDIPTPKSPLSFLIELDRKGFDDMVFYDCANEKFEDYIKEFGFNTHYGSFSDISTIAPEWEIAAVNLSIGYEDEHTRYERLYYHNMFKTIAKVRQILEAEMIEPHPFNFIRGSYAYGYSEEWWEDEYKYLDQTMVVCDCCNSLTKKAETKVIYDTGSYWRMCKKCTDAFSRVCKKCGNRFLPWSDHSPETLCLSCRRKESQIKGEELDA